jgi:hypothetical protein
MNQIDDDKSWLNWLADTDELVAFSPRLRDIASRLGKLDGWKDIRLDCPPEGVRIIACAYGEIVLGYWYNSENAIWDTNEIGSGSKYAIKHWMPLPELPEAVTAPETPAQKYEMITGEKAYYKDPHGNPTCGLPMPDYIAWLEADKPDDWGSK